MLDTDASEFATDAILFQKFDDGNIHLCSFVPPKLPSAECIYDVYATESLAIVHTLAKCWHFIHSIQPKVTIYADQ